MKINRALGLGLGIIVLKLLLGGVFTEFEDTLVLFFDTAQTFLHFGQAAVISAPPFIPH